MNWLGMLVDLSHVSPETMEDAIRVSPGRRDFFRTRQHEHSTMCRVMFLTAFCGFCQRTVVLVMVTFVPGFLSPAVAAWNKLQDAERDRLTKQFPGVRGSSNPRRE
jgi:membrane dipeptidase